MSVFLTQDQLECTLRNGCKIDEEDEDSNDYNSLNRCNISVYEYLYCLFLLLLLSDVVYSIRLKLYCAS